MFYVIVVEVILGSWAVVGLEVWMGRSMAMTKVVAEMMWAVADGGIGMVGWWNGGGGGGLEVLGPYNVSAKLR